MTLRDVIEKVISTYPFGREALGQMHIEADGYNQLTHLLEKAIEREGVWVPWSDIQPMRDHELHFMGRIEYYPTVVWHDWINKCDR